MTRAKARTLVRMVGARVEEDGVLVPSGSVMCADSFAYRLIEPVVAKPGVQRVRAAVCERADADEGTLAQPTVAMAHLLVASLRGSAQWDDIDALQREVTTLESIHAAYDGAGGSELPPCVPRPIETFEYRRDADSSQQQQQVALRVHASELPPESELLSDLISRRGWRASAAQLESLVEQLLAGVQQLSLLSPPVIVQNIGPSNLLVSLPEKSPSKLRLCLRDLSMASSSLAPLSADVRDYLESHSDSVYIAPEVHQNFVTRSDSGTASVAADLYSVGATILFILLGRDPSSPTSPLSPPPELAAAKQRSASNLRRVVSVVEALLKPQPLRVESAEAALALLHGKSEAAASQEQSLVRKTHAGGVLDRKVGDAVASLVADRGDWQSGGVRDISDALDVSAGRIALLLGPRELDDLSESDVRAAAQREAVTLGGFALAWNGIVGAWTLSAIASGGVAALFSIPFWLAGADVSRKAFRAAKRASGSQSAQALPSADSSALNRALVPSGSSAGSEELLVVDTAQRRVIVRGGDSKDGIELSASDIDGALRVDVSRDALCVAPGVYVGRQLSTSQQVRLGKLIHRALSLNGAAPTAPRTPFDDDLDDRRYRGQFGGFAPGRDDNWP
uniref:Protein kinase domain-containing protein n=1 Tax=Erythrolobus australicus TaxID=1077150 RepID=A0A7S1TLY0_9RHOD